RNLRHIAHRDLEQFVSLHFYEVKALVDRLVRGWIFRSTTRSIQTGRLIAIGLNPGRKDSSILIFHSRYNCSAGSVAEDYAGRAIGVIDVPSQQFRSYHQNILMHSASDKLVCYRQSV